MCHAQSLLCEPYHCRRVSKYVSDPNSSFNLSAGPTLWYNDVVARVIFGRRAASSLDGHIPCDVAWTGLIFWLIAKLVDPTGGISLWGRERGATLLTSWISIVERHTEVCCSDSPRWNAERSCSTYCERCDFRYGSDSDLDGRNRDIRFTSMN